MSEIGKSQLEKSIFFTIAYYDYFNYPLTAGEIYQYLINLNPKSEIRNPKQILNSKIQTNSNDPAFAPLSHKAADGRGKAMAGKQNQKTEENIQYPISNIEKEINQAKSSFYEVLKILDDSRYLQEFIERKNGFYFLKGREAIIKERIQKKKLADQKFKKTKWILSFISYLPFVRLIMLSGSMGLGNPYKESDIDLLVVAKAGRIWTTRAILTFFTLVFGAYRHTGKTQNRLCLNHYITDKSLGINFGNLYKAEEYLNLLPLAGDFDIYKNFFERNAWIKNYTYSASGSLEKNLRAIPLKGLSLKIKYFFEFLLSGFIGDYFEKCIKKFQVYFIEKNPLTKSPDARIRYDDSNLVFHPVLVEPEVIGKYEEKIKKFLAFVSS